MEYFISLWQLYCDNNQLTSLPTLPASLIELRCNNNQLTSLPTLPTGLQELICDNNQLASLPALPASLQTLWCFNNQLASLTTLPAILQILYCNNNLLTSLPALPVNLQSLICHNNLLTSLPIIPANLQTFTCYNNQLDFADLETINVIAVGGDPYANPQNYEILPVAQTVAAGTTLTISGGIGGSLNVYQWYKDNILISGATSANYTKINITHTDIGVYRCIITSTYVGAATIRVSIRSSNVTVSVTGLSSQTITLPTISTKTYGDAGFSLGASTTSGLPLTYVSSNTNIATVSATGIVSIVGAGTTNITVSQAGNASYASATTSGTLVVNKASLTMTAEDKTRIVGVANPVFTFTYLGFVLGENQNTANLFTQAPTASTVANLSSVAGTYAIVPSAIIRCYTVSFVNGTLTVTNPTPIAQTITLPIIPTKTYGDAGFSLGASTNSGLPLTYASANPSIAVVSASGIVSIIGAGTTNITASQAGNASYASATTSGTLVVNKASLTMTAEDKTRIVGVANPVFTFTYLGFVLGENQNTANLFTQAPTATCVANLSSVAGTYSIVPSAIAQNYNIAFINGLLTVTNPTPIAQTITLPTISTKTYGDAGFSLGASTNSGLLLTYTSDNMSIATISATGIVSIIGAGTTNITVSQAGNGGFSPAIPVTQVLTILKKDLTVTAQTFITEACNGTDIYFPLTYSGFVNGETSLNLATLPVGFVGSTKSTTVLRVNNTFVPKNGVGKLKNPFVVRTYTISVAGGVSNNYNFIYVTGAVTLTQCPIWRTTTTPTASTETLDNEITVYPNPSNSDFKVDFGSLEMNKAIIRVYDMQGKQVYTTEIENNISEIKNTTNVVIISLGNMINGIYLLQISTEKGNIQKKIVKAD